MVSIVAMLAMLVTGIAAQGQDTVAKTANTITLVPGAARPAAQISEMAWLAGHWQGQGLGGEVDEVWSAPAGGAMVGHFRLVTDGKPSFYEIMTLLQSEGSLEMRLKHVNPDMTGWEEKGDFVTFRLARLEPQVAYFNGLTFRRTGEHGLEVFLALRNRADGTVREERFVMQRIK